MSISDMIVVMKDGVLQQIGKPQDVYDDPINLFVAEFLGTPPINVFHGKIENGKLYAGQDMILEIQGAEDQAVEIGIRPEGFVLDENGPLCCNLNRVEVMGRDISVVSTHSACDSPAIRSIISAENHVNMASPVVRFRVKPAKVLVFNKETEKRVQFDVPQEEIYG